MTLKEWREKKGLTQTQLANQLSNFAGTTLKRRSLCNWEKGTLPRKQWLIVIAEFTHNKVDWGF